MHGDPQSEIVKKSQEVKADIVIVGSHGSGLIKRFVFAHLPATLKCCAQLTVFLEPC